MKWFCFFKMFCNNYQTFRYHHYNCSDIIIKYLKKCITKCISQIYQISVFSVYCFIYIYIRSLYTTLLKYIKIELHTDLKIITLDYQNNYVEYSEVTLTLLVYIWYRCYQLQSLSFIVSHVISDIRYPE